MRSYTASPGRYTNTGRRVVFAGKTRTQLVGFSLRPLVSGSHLFAVLLGSTVDTCYVSLQRLLWETAEIVPFSAQCSVRHWIYGAASLRGHSTGAALGQGFHALIQRCITVEVPQLQFLFMVVNIPVGAQRQLPMVLLSDTIEFLLLQYIDKAVDVGCASPASSLVQSVRRQSRSHSCSFDAGHCRSHACCCATTGAWAGRDSAETVGFRSWHCLLVRLMTCPPACRLFRAVYTGTRPKLTPAIKAGKGWRGRRELAPRCSATQLAARRHDPGQTRRVLNCPYHQYHRRTDMVQPLHASYLTENHYRHHQP